MPPPMPADAPATLRTARKAATGAEGPLPQLRRDPLDPADGTRSGGGDEMPSYIGSPQYLEQRDFSKPIVGPVLGISFGKGQTTQTFVGAAGSETMRRRILQITYEVTVAFDDGRFGLIELQNIDDLRVGDRVRVDGSRLELVKK